MNAVSPVSLVRGMAVVEIQGELRSKSLRMVYNFAVTVFYENSYRLIKLMKYFNDTEICSRLVNLCWGDDNPHPQNDGSEK